VSDADLELLLRHRGTHVRPAPRRQPPLPPFDPDDRGGQVHRVKPIELDIPARDNLFMKADFNGVTLDLARWGIPQPEKGRTLLDMQGANSTPAAMLMSPMLILYPRKIQDAHLTESAERNLTHYVISQDAWNAEANGVSISQQQVVEWARYLRSWGFFVVYWRGGTPVLNDPVLQALVNASVIDWYIAGGEVDRRGVTSEQYAGILDNALAITGRGIPIGAHFTANYPEGFPRDTFLINWADYDGQVHLCWQAEPTEPAGTQGARLYYARLRVNLGQIGGDGRLALNSRVCAFETMATAQLYAQEIPGYGPCDERYGKLRTLQLLYTTRLDPRIRAMDGGFGNGCGLPSGDNL
jgi:hypothetical protein